MNSIATAQNSERSLQRLAAQRQLYATAKTIFKVQAFVGGPLALATAILSAAYPSVKGYAALWGLLVALGDHFWLRRWQKRLQELAAQTQELFDCDVLTLEWNKLKVRRPPDPELVKEQSEKYQSWAAQMPPLTDWYAPEVSSLPLHVGRIACQRSNCWWDAKQKRRYAQSVIAIVTVIFIAVLCVALADGATIENFILGVAAPLAPMLVLGIRQFSENAESAERSDRLKEHAESLWESALSGRPEQEVTRGSRDLQDEIFERRKRSPGVLDSIYKWLRRDYETQMQHGVAELVAEAKKRLGLQ